MFDITCQFSAFLLTTFRLRQSHGQTVTSPGHYLFLSFFLLVTLQISGLTEKVSAGPVTTVSAASYSAQAITPESIVAAFGSGMAASTVAASGDADPVMPGIQLPTVLGGISVEVNGRRAGLFYISPLQINYQIPGETLAGTATVVVKSATSVDPLANGTVTISQVAPAIFTANTFGTGAPAALVQRYRGNTFLGADSAFIFDPVINGLVPKPVSFGASDESIFLVLFLSGVRRAADSNGDGNVNEGIRVLIGGVEFVPAYAGRQGDLAGLDQLNVELPRSLANLPGRLSLTVTSTGGISSNPVEIEIAAGGSALQISGFGSESVVAGEILSINGSGFSTNLPDNTVRILGAENEAKAQVVQATATRLDVLIPFGAETGKVSVVTPLGQGVSTKALAVKTSLSGFVKDSLDNKIRGATIRVTDRTGKVSTAVTSSEGSFVIADIADGTALITLDGQTVTNPPYPQVFLKQLIRANRDNQLNFPSALQSLSNAVTGARAEGEPAAFSLSTAAPAGRHELRGSIRTGNVVLDVPNGAVIRNANGTIINTLSLTLVDRSQTPMALPASEFSSAIALIAPVGGTITPGGKLTFPNSDGFPAGARVRLYKLDQQRASATVGEFVDVGAATISTDGQRIETAAGAITEATYYFVSVPRRLVTLVGRVIESNRLPVRRAILDSRGQSIFTDGNGGFVIRSVPVNVPATPSSQNEQVAFVELNEGSAIVTIDNDTLDVRANFMRPTTVVDTAQKGGIAPVATGTTAAGDLTLTANRPNQNPTITAPGTLNVTAGQTQNFSIVVADPDPGQTIRASVSGAAFVSLIPAGTDIYTLRIAPGANDVGTYSLIVTAVDNLGGIATRNIALTVR